MGNTRHQQARWGSAAWSPGQREPRRGRLRRSESMKPRQGRGRTGAARAGHRRGPRPGQPQLRVWTRKRSVRKSTPARGRGRSLSRDGSAGHCGPGGRTRPLTLAAQPERNDEPFSPPACGVLSWQRMDEGYWLIHGCSQTHLLPPASGHSGHQRDALCGGGGAGPEPLPIGISSFLPPLTDDCWIKRSDDPLLL